MWCRFLTFTEPLCLTVQLSGSVSGPIPGALFRAPKSRAFSWNKHHGLPNLERKWRQSGWVYPLSADLKFWETYFSLFDVSVASSSNNLNSLDEVWDQFQCNFTNINSFFWVETLWNQNNCLSLPPEKFRLIMDNSNWTIPTFQGDKFCGVPTISLISGRFRRNHFLPNLRRLRYKLYRRWLRLILLSNWRPPSCTCSDSSW